MTDPTCSVTFDDGTPCERPVHSFRSRGHCDICGNWSNKHGRADPNGRRRGRRNGGLIADLRAAAASTSDDCVVLTGFQNRPQVIFKGVSMSCARAVWIIANGDPGDLWVLHTCHRGDEGCVNLRHLYLGDHGRNMRDMVEARRSCHNERHYGVKLTDEQVCEIRRTYIPGTGRNDRGNAVELAARYGVGKKTIRDVATGRSRASLECP